MFRKTHQLVNKFSRPLYKLLESTTSSGSRPKYGVFGIVEKYCFCISLMIEMSEARRRFMEIVVVV